MVLSNFVSFGYLFVFIWAVISINSMDFFDVCSSVRSVQSILIGCLKRVSFHLLQSLFHVPSLLYTTLYFQEAVNFLQPILLLTFSKYCCCLTYSVPSSFLHPGRRWCTVSLCYPHILHLSHTTNPLIFFHALVSIIFLHPSFHSV